MPVRKREPTKRITLDLTPRFYDRLERLEDLVEGESKAVVIRNALRLYEFIAQKTMEGSSFKLVQNDGTEERIVFLGPQM